MLLKVYKYRKHLINYYLNFFINKDTKIFLDTMWRGTIWVSGFIWKPTPSWEWEMPFQLLNPIEFNEFIEFINASAYYLIFKLNLFNQHTCFLNSSFVCCLFIPGQQQKNIQFLSFIIAFDWFYTIIVLENT